MTRFLDGPANGSFLLLRRAPVFLRAVQKRGDEKWDALDQLNDRPAVEETIVVYERVSEPTWCHIRATNGGGIYRGGDYRVIEPQPGDDVLRDQVQWERWASAAFKAKGIS